MMSVSSLSLNPRLLQIGCSSHPRPRPTIDIWLRAVQAEEAAQRSDEEIVRLANDVACLQSEVAGERSVRQSMAQEAAALEGIAGRVSQLQHVLSVNGNQGCVVTACWWHEARRCSRHLPAAA